VCPAASLAMDTSGCVLPLCAETKLGLKEAGRATRRSSCDVSRIGHKHPGVLFMSSYQKLPTITIGGLLWASKRCILHVAPRSSGEETMTSTDFKYPDFYSYPPYFTYVISILLSFFTHLVKRSMLRICRVQIATELGYTREANLAMEATTSKFL
jgi:hypothetical protein